jgi:hypothetical protein
MHAPSPESQLREDLSKEYYALLGVVSSYDGWLLIVKGWSVTLSLAALGLGFQQEHYTLFLLAAVTGAAFWVLDALMKGYQYRYYVRMREIEYTAYLINAVPLGGDEYRNLKISAPRIDMTWSFTGYPVDKDTGKPLPVPQPWWRRWWRRMFGSDEERKPGGGEHTEKPEKDHNEHAEEPEKDHPDWRADKPWRRKPQDIYSKLRSRWHWANVMLPHVLAVGLGGLLFIIFAALNASGVGHLHL